MCSCLCHKICDVHSTRRAVSFSSLFSHLLLFVLCCSFFSCHEKSRLFPRQHRLSALQARPARGFPGELLTPLYALSEGRGCKQVGFSFVFNYLLVTTCDALMIGFSLLKLQVQTLSASLLLSLVCLCVQFWKAIETVLNCSLGEDTVQNIKGTFWKHPISMGKKGHGL